MDAATSINNPLLDRITALFIEQRPLWSTKERKAQPNITDKLFNYLISYLDHPSAARRAIRIFRGIELSDPRFCGWNEVRVATLNEIRDTLSEAGVTNTSWELSIAIKDFLQNTVDTIGDCEFEGKYTPNELTAYFEQLKGKPEAWGKGESSPFRPYYSIFSRKNVRRANEPILPASAYSYLRLLLSRTTFPPFEFHTERVLSRLGVINRDDTHAQKRLKYHQFLGSDKPVTKHRRLVEFGKILCLTKAPRCNVCPLQADCQYAKIKLNGNNQRNTN